MKTRILVLGCVLLCAVVAQTGAQQAPSAAASGSKPGTVLITGSNRGLGLEFVTQYAARGWKVIATARAPESATELRALAGKNNSIAIEKLDVLDRPAIKVLAAK